MYKKILFGTCLSEYCDHIFNFALNLAIENNAKLWIYHGLGRLDLSEEEDPPQFVSGFTYRWRIDSVGAGILDPDDRDKNYSGSESQWFSFIAN